MVSSYAFIGLVTIILSSLILVSYLNCLAVLICLEHSFWLIQQGSSPIDGFTKALDIYIEDKHVLIDQRLRNYLMLKKSKDWFTIKHCPSNDECTEFQKIVLDNLLRMIDSCFF